MRVNIRKSILERRILLIECYEGVRKSITDVLEHFHYNVDTASNGNEVLEKFKEAYISRNRYDVVITCLMGDGTMKGEDVPKILKEIDPDVKVIAASGSHDHDAMKNPEKYGFKATLEKPYNLQELRRTLYEVINND